MTTFTFTTLNDPLGTGTSKDTFLGLPESGTLTAAISATSGTIVGVYFDSSGAGHGYIYNGTTFTPLNDPLATDGTGAFSVNDSGQVVGTFNNGAPNGFLYSGGNFTTIDDPLGPTYAMGINNSGQIVGFYDGPSGTKGFLYSGSSYTTISDPLGNITAALGINNKGQVVGAYLDSNFLGHGFVYTNGSFVTLDDPLGVEGTAARGINDSGQVVGVYQDSNGISHGFLYSGGTYTTIDDPLGVNGSAALGINNAGEIVGAYVGSNNLTQGFTTEAPSTGPTVTNPIFPFTGDSYSQIETIYIAYFGRAGDPGGTTYWGGQLASGALSITGEAASYSVQPESLAQYPFLVNPLTASTTGANNALDGFINSVYLNLFGHAADGTDTTGGLGYWRGNILSALATNNAGTVAQELGVFCIQVAFGAQGADVTSLTNKVTVADFLTEALTAANVSFTTAVNTLAHTAIASVTSDSSTVTAAETTISSFLTTHPNGALVSLVGTSEISPVS
jgi:probable HAF family extracellular repeat protein